MRFKKCKEYASLNIVEMKKTKAEISNTDTEWVEKIGNAVTKLSVCILPESGRIELFAMVHDSLQGMESVGLYLDSEEAIDVAMTLIRFASQISEAKKTEGKQ